MAANDKEKSRENEEGAQLLSGQLGKTVQRLRKAYNFSLSDLAEQSGVAKSIISQIERNETNPTLATIWRLSQALDVSVEDVLRGKQTSPFLEKSSKADTPILLSEDGKCRLAIIGWVKTVSWLQWYDMHAEAGGILESEGHQLGSIESLSVLSGAMEVEVDGHIMQAKAGETLRYYADRPHIVRCLDGAPAHASMILMMKVPSVDA